MASEIDVKNLREAALSAPDMGGYFEVPEDLRDTLHEAIESLQQWEAMRHECFRAEPCKWPDLRVELYGWLLDYNQRVLRAAVERRNEEEPRYELTDLGKAYRDVMQRGAKLNGEVKAGEE